MGRMSEDLSQFPMAQSMGFGWEGGKLTNSMLAIESNEGPKNN